MVHNNAFRSAAFVIPVAPILQALFGMFAAFVSVIALGKLTAYTLMHWIPGLAVDTVNYNAVIVPLLGNAGLFVVLRRRTPVFASFFLVSALLLTALPLTAWCAA